MTYSSAARGRVESEWELLICLGNFRNILAITFHHLLPERHLLLTAQGAKHLKNIIWGRISSCCYFFFSVGLVKDGSKTLRELNVTNGVKMMVVGSTINDVMKVTPPPPGALKEEKTTSGREGWDKWFLFL